jgi:hypothetical protein
MRHIAREGVCHVIGVAPAARFSDVPDTVPDRDRLWRGADPHGRPKPHLVSLSEAEPGLG